MIRMQVKAEWMYSNPPHSHFGRRTAGSGECAVGRKPGTQTQTGGQSPSFPTTAPDDLSLKMSPHGAPSGRLCLPAFRGRGTFAGGFGSGKGWFLPEPERRYELKIRNRQKHRHTDVPGLITI